MNKRNFATAILSGTILGLMVLALYCLVAPSHCLVAQKFSPNGSMQASVEEINGGATTPFAYEVFLKSKAPFATKTLVATLSGASRNMSAWGVDLKWTDDTHLLVSYWKAKFAKLKKTNVREGKNEVLVILNKGVLNANAAPGGMEYSARNQGTLPLSD